MKGKKNEIERVASTTTVEKMIQLMDDTVNGIGNTGSGYRIDSHELIGKTGTAQIAAENGRGYLNGKNDIISSFAGIYPKSNPEIIIYASVKRPSNGSQKPISNAVKEVVLNTGKYLGTEKQAATDQVIEYKLPSFINKNLEKVKTTLTNNGMNYQIIGNGTKVVKQYPAFKTTVTNKDKIYLITNDNNYVIPNVVGLSSKEAKSLLEILGVKVKLEGSGYVKTQSISENTPITDGMEIVLSLDKKFESFGFNVICIDGHNIQEIKNAFEIARNTKGKPTCIIAKTVKGKGVSFMENQVGWHGKAPNEEEYKMAMEELSK